MHSLKSLLLILGATSFSTQNPSFAIEENPDGTVNVTYDCWNLGVKELRAPIWSANLPVKLFSLTIRNCEHLVLNISTISGIESNMRYLIVSNVRKCEITGEAFSETSLPSQTIFRDVNRMKVEIPLYGETSFNDGVLQFDNVTVGWLKSGVIALGRSSLRKFSMARVRVTVAERDAVVFRGSLNSVLEIENSIFYSVDGNFISCNVTGATIRNNLFAVVKEGGFSLETMTFNSSGNIAIAAEDCAVKLHSRAMKKKCTCTMENDSFERKICVQLTTENSENEEETVTDVPRVIHYGIGENDRIEEGKEVTRSATMRLGNQLLLLWFLAMTLLILLFPLAYFTKICLCRIVDKAFPLPVKHERLVNAEDA